MAEHSHSKDAAHAGEHGIGRYLLIWALLIVGTIVTVATGRMDLGAANIFIAILIATTKATLVVLFFMHMWDMGGVNRLVFVVSVLFLVVLILGVFGDLMVRLPATLPNGGPMPMAAPSAAGAIEHVPSH